MKNMNSSVDIKTLSKTLKSLSQTKCQNQTVLLVNFSKHMHKVSENRKTTQILLWGQHSYASTMWRSYYKKDRLHVMSLIITDSKH